MPPSRDKKNFPEIKNAMSNMIGPTTAKIRPCHINSSARSCWLAPNALAIADETAFPNAPTDNICISISIGKTNAMAASGVLPS